MFTTICLDGISMSWYFFNLHVCPASQSAIQTLWTAWTRKVHLVSWDPACSQVLHMFNNRTKVDTETWISAGVRPSLTNLIFKKWFWKIFLIGISQSDFNWMLVLRCTNIYNWKVKNIKSIFVSEAKHSKKYWGRIYCYCDKQPTTYKYFTRKYFRKEER